MKYELLTPNSAQWDAFVSVQPQAHFLQLSAWGELKRAFHWRCECIALAQDGAIVAGAQLLFRPLPLRLGSLAYLAMGPYQASASDSEAQRVLWEAIHTCARRHGAAWLKWEPGMSSDGNLIDANALGFRPSGQTIQPPRTILIDIQADDEVILSRMNQGTRRKIRQSLKHNIRYYEGAAADVATFNALMRMTGTRNAFGVHEPEYYSLAYRLFVPQHAALFLAEHENDPLAGIMVFALGTNAWYVYGASSDIKRNLMASYGVQWQAIRWARARGCNTYDLWGVPDEDESVLEAQFEQRSDGLWGVYGFKRGWGGRVVRSAAAWDYVYQPLLYAAYRTVLQLRAG